MQLLSCVVPSTPLGGNSGPGRKAGGPARARPYHGLREDVADSYGGAVAFPPGRDTPHMSITLHAGLSRCRCGAGAGRAVPWAKLSCFKSKVKRLLPMRLSHAISMGTKCHRSSNE